MLNIYNIAKITIDIMREISLLINYIQKGERIMEERIINESEEMMEVCEMEPVERSSGSGLVGKVIVGGILTGIAGALAYGFTHKEEIKQKRLEKKAAKLEAAGYFVARPDEFDEETIIENEEIEDENEEIEE